MNIKEFEKYALDLFNDNRLIDAINNEEIGLTYSTDKDVKVIGYSTNLTPEIITKASKLKIDLILTHHDSWKSIPTMKESCAKLLKEHHISHFFSHLPLDDANFGTNASLAKELGFNIIRKFCIEDDYNCGVICELDEAIELSALVKTVERTLNETVKFWINNPNKVKRIGIVTGGGFSPIDLKEAYENGCDTYITGEKILYTIQYAELVNLNLIVGSHTFTEIFGVKEFAKKIKSKFPDISIIQIEERHNE